MGAWGYGLLQNDDAQDGLLTLADGIETDIARLRRRRPAEELAGRLAAAVGLLLHLQIWHVFDPENEFNATLQAVLERHEPMFGVLPKGAVDILGALRQGKGGELVRREGSLPDELNQAFFAADPGFPMERGTGLREPFLFEHPASAEYVQEVADRLVKKASAGFRNRDLMCDISCDGGETVAALCILLQIEPCQVPAEKFREWWAQYRAGTAPEGEDDFQDEFDQKYGQRLRQALDYGLRKFSGKKDEVKPLEG